MEVLRKGEACSACSKTQQTGTPESKRDGFMPFCFYLRLKTKQLSIVQHVFMLAIKKKIIIMARIRARPAVAPPCAPLPLSSGARMWHGSSAEPHKSSAITSVMPCLRISNILSFPPGCLAAESARRCVMYIIGNQISWVPSSCFPSKTTCPLN